MAFTLPLLLLLFVATANTNTVDTNGGTDSGPQEMEQRSGNDDLITTCPTWTFRPTAGDTCKCGSSHGGIVKCDQETRKSVLPSCYCATYDTQQTRIVVGNCLFGCANTPVYSVPSNRSDLNGICNEAKRSGQLCGGCQDGHAPPVYSYLLSCVPCSEGESNIGRYLAVALVPLTVFFIAIVASGFSATAASMNAFILVSQITANPIQLRVAETVYAMTNAPSFQVNGLRVMASVYGVWSLDFFRMVYKPFCLHHRMNTLQVLAMDYIVAIYPMALTVAVYFLVKLYDRKFKVIVWLWKPFRWFLLGFKTQWNIRTSLIDTFATFFLLSWTKLFMVSGDFLIYTQTIDVHGKLRGKYLYFDGTIEYLGDLHIPYIVIPVIIVTIAFLPSMLLCLYPCRCFQRLLNRFRLRCFVLHTFMDAFQGCYKDGTNGTRDCRYFAGGYLWVRFILYLTYAMIVGPVYYLAASIVLIVLVAFLVTARPYKTSIFNITDPLLILLVVVVYMAVLTSALDIPNAYYTLIEVVVSVAVILPLLYLAAVALYQFFVKTGRLHRIHHKLQAVISRRLKRATFLEESLPDRLIHAGEYEALLPQSVANWLQRNDRSSESDKELSAQGTY